MGSLGPHIYLVRHYLGAWMRVFLVKINFDMGILSKADCLSQTVCLTKSTEGLNRTKGWLCPK